MNLKKALKNTSKKRRKVAALLILALGISNTRYVAASALDKAEKKKNEAQANLDEVNAEIAGIQNAQNSLQAEMNSYDAQMMNLLTDMEILAGDIEVQKQEIDEANTNLKVAEYAEEQQYDAMKLRIRYMYENGDQSVWKALLESGSMTEMLNRVEYVSDVYTYDRQLLTDYQNTVQQVEDLKAQLENEMAEMEELEISYQEQQTSLNRIIAQKQSEMDNFDSQLASAKSLAGRYAQTIKQQNQVIAKEKARLAAEAEEKAKKEKEKNKDKNKNNSTSTAGTGTGGTSTAGTGTGGTGTAETGTGGGGTDTTTSGGTENSKPSSSTGLTDTGLNPSYKTNVSGSDIVSYASQFLGNPYVFGGTSLTNGADCSYFVKAVYQHFGITVPRSSYEQRNCGQAVSYENARPGDIICYSGHVAIYIGNGKIIHASSPKNGICYGNATYRTIIAVRRVL